MRRLAFLTVALALLAGAVHGQANATAVLDKAIAAAGGEAKLAKLQGLTLKGKGNYHEAGKPDIPFTSTWYTQGNDKGRTINELEAMGAKSYEVRVINGDKGWVKDGKLEARVMDKDDLADERENLYFNWVTTLAPLKGKDFKLTAAEDAKVDGKAAAAFSVSSKGHRDIKLYFDKESGLLVKSERKVRDSSANKDVVEEVYFSNFKDADGIKIAMKYSVKWDGQPQADVEMTEAKAQEKLDDKLFQKP